MSGFNRDAIPGPYNKTGEDFKAGMGGGGFAEDGISAQIEADPSASDAHIQKMRSLLRAGSISSFFNGRTGRMERAQPANYGPMAPFLQYEPQPETPQSPRGTVERSVEDGERMLSPTGRIKRHSARDVARRSRRW